MKVNFKEVIDTVGKFTDEHKPELATGVGIALMVGGTVAAVVATVKTMKACSAAKEEKLAAIAPNKEAYDDLTAEEVQLYDEIENSPLPRKEVIAICWKWWMIPALTEALGIFCLIFSNRESAKRIGSLTAAFAYQLAEAKDYKEAAREILGEDKEQEIEDEAVRKSTKRRKESTVVNNDNLPRFGTAVQRYREYYSGAMFWADPIYIKSCEQTLNDLILDARDDGHDQVKLCEWLDILGVDRAGCGEELAFDVKNGLVSVRMTDTFAGLGDDGLTTYVLHFNNPPTYYKFI